MPTPNALINERSPYLQQHAHNPVAWEPWGEAAFERARREDKPIFLSIGYSTCHWCHVMERESFENDDTAQLMNRHFVPVKVDREERPDVDRLYMTYVQATTGSGGWPMSVFLTPQLKPFYGGTYFPPDDAYGRPGFASLLAHLARAWHDDRAKIEQSGDNVIEALGRYASHSVSDGEAPWATILDGGIAQLRQSFDKRHGGFGGPPKFPRPVQHLFLHRYHLWRGSAEALEMSRLTLYAMVRGGMHDHLGGGFHRYSVDGQWIVSHFEKMLYDQAQLVVALLEMFQVTGEQWCADAAHDTISYVLRDMTHPEGGFYSAEDADSLATPQAAHKEEGAFYVWEQSEIEALLTADEAALAIKIYNVAKGGNAPREGDPHGEFRGKNILYCKGVEERDEDALRGARAKLFAARELRPRPHRDEKVITAWNGMMISALSRAAIVLDTPEYAEAAQRAAGFLRRELYQEQAKTLLRHYCDGAAAVPGFADDYAFLAQGLLDLFEATSDLHNLEWSEALLDRLNADFLDDEAGGYYASAPDPHVLLRLKEDYDGAEPSANSVAASTALRLGGLLDRSDLVAVAGRTMVAFADRLEHAASAMPGLLSARLLAELPPLHVVVAGDRDDPATHALLATARAPFLPHAVVLLWSEALVGRLPFMAGMKPLEGRPAAYVCRDFACRQPVTDPEELAALLAE